MLTVCSSWSNSSSSDDDKSIISISSTSSNEIEVIKTERLNYDINFGINNTIIIQDNR